MQPFPYPSDATHKIWSRLANWLQRYSSLKVWTTTDDDDGPLVYYKLTLWAFGSGELKTDVVTTSCRRVVLHHLCKTTFSYTCQSLGNSCQACRIFSICTSQPVKIVIITYLHIRVWYTDSRRWKTWLLTARLCSSRNGGNTTPSRTGNVNRSSSISKRQIKHMYNLQTILL